MSKGNKTAVVIDEEPHFSEIMTSALRIAGFDVVQFFEATSALNSILADRDSFANALMFVDMALEPGMDEKVFSMEATDKYMTTGLVLAGKLVLEDIVVQARRQNIILYSAHQRGQFWSKIDQFCDTYGTRKWQKRADADIQEIFELASHHVE